MFGLSPTKILFTVAVIAIVWYGFKWLNRAQNKTGNRNKDANVSQRKAQDSSFEELVACDKCGDYVVPDKKNGCGQSGCPFEK